MASRNTNSSDPIIQPHLMKQMEQRDVKEEAL